MPNKYPIATKIVLLCLITITAACFKDPFDKSSYAGAGGASAPMCGGKLAPVCPQGCEPGCYHDPTPMLSAMWECDPIDPKITPPGVCGPMGPCFEDGIECGQDAYCCSLVCSEQGVCEPCRGDLEGCSEASQCCSGICSLNACGG